MGTRHLTVAYADGKYKLAQYGQWDGYPEGAGVCCLNFLNEIMYNGRYDEFVRKVKVLQNITEEEYNKIFPDNATQDEILEALSKHPEFHRDTGCDILKLILDSPEGMKIHNRLNFAADSLMCEWVWLLDLDNGKFEGYMGFNTQPLDETDRFYFLRDKENDYNNHQYHGVKLVKSWSFDELPDVDEFCSAFELDEDEE